MRRGARRGAKSEPNTDFVVPRVRFHRLAVSIYPDIHILRSQHRNRHEGREGIRRARGQGRGGQRGGRGTGRATTGVSQCTTTEPSLLASRCSVLSGWLEHESYVERSPVAVSPRPTAPSSILPPRLANVLPASLSPDTHHSTCAAGRRRRWCGPSQASALALPPCPDAAHPALSRTRRTYSARRTTRRRRGRSGGSAATSSGRRTTSRRRASSQCSSAEPTALASCAAWCVR